MWYPQFKYDFNSKNSNYINALIDLYGAMPIKSLKINDRTVHEISTVGQIISFLNNNQEQEIEIITERVTASATTFGVFPKFQVQDQYIQDSPNDTLRFSDTIEKAINCIIRTSIDLEPTELPEIKNREDAWKVINLILGKKFKYPAEFPRAIDCPSINSILIISPRHLSLMTYGKELNIMHEIGFPAFDIDDGFVPDPFTGFSCVELVNAFTEWKNNDRQGGFSFIANYPEPLIDHKPELSNTTSNPSVIKASIFTKPSEQHEASPTVEDEKVANYSV